MEEKKKNKKKKSSPAVGTFMMAIGTRFPVPLTIEEERMQLKETL